MGRSTRDLEKNHDGCLVPGIHAPDRKRDNLQRGKCNRNAPEDLTSHSTRWGEHRPECGGASWSAVLPVDAVLGARMFNAGLYEDSRVSKNSSDSRGTGALVKVDSLCHHYDDLNLNDKLELHVLGVVIAHCVVKPDLLDSRIQLAAIASKLVGLIAQARVNSMAISCMYSPDFGNDGKGQSPIPGLRQIRGSNISRNTQLCSVNQVKVAQGVFLVGSLLNHSCVPNVHASFISGRLAIRAIMSLEKGSSLELCYGPQLGKHSQLERKQELRERYFFTCTCYPCSTATLPDVVLRSFRCAKSGCLGVVLGPEISGANSRTTPVSSLKACSGEREEEKRDFVGYGSPKKQYRVWPWHSTGTIDVRHIDNEFVKSRHVCKESYGRCLACGTVVDIEKVCVVAISAMTYLDRVESDLSTGAVNEKELLGALKALESLKQSLHAYNEQLAKGEDILAQLMCALDQPVKALKHCQRSIEILERLYNKNHIVIGNEYLKLASIAAMASDLECARRSLSLAHQILITHYGDDYGSKLSYVIRLQQMVL